MVRVLFVCSKNCLRSPTAESVFGAWRGLQVASAGIDSDARVPLDVDLVEWADVIFVMEPFHRDKLANKFERFIRRKRVVVLDIPDQYEYMDASLIRLLRTKVSPYLRGVGARPPP